ncbi:hypothetical protein [Pseudomonas sichuanensis]|uniref:hypothetical protein n=1 Tax=Pseudomonas sichuanensis TaxID=2213015 RepID=UPI002ABA5374|nr:hypothetical protein [Pseudomonas sichuanensis]MDZ4017055.1 hypothetical protein [Pseudomonas sichuanensis]
MFDVLHPLRNEMINHHEYVQLAADQGYQRPNDYLGGRCPVCKGRMDARAGHNHADGHFYHVADQNCPTKQPNARPYLGKPPSRVDPDQVRLNREFAQTHLDHYWNKLTELVPFLDFAEFITVLEEAKRLNVYAYVGLDPKLLPYVYATLINYLPSKSYNKARKLKFCFFFDARIQHFEDLWINRGHDRWLSRVSYDGSQTRRVNRFELTDDYLQQVAPPLSPARKKWALAVC